MLSAEFDEQIVHRLVATLRMIRRKDPIEEEPPLPHLPHRACSIREALFAKQFGYPAPDACGRIFADLSCSCPPAIPILICGETVDEHAIELFDYYGITFCSVVDDR